MRALVIYESMFGDAKAIALAIGDGLRISVEQVEVQEVGLAPERIPAGTDLLVIGSPTHGFGLPTPQNRKDAAQRIGGRPVISQGVGVREWLTTLHIDAGQLAAVFDTRMSHPKTVTRLDHASHTIERRLRGCAFLDESRHFFVTDVTGPLAPGESERARTWGRRLGARLVAGQPSH